MTLKPGQSLWLLERDHGFGGLSAVPALRHMQKVYLTRVTPLNMSPEPRLALRTSLSQTDKVKPCPEVQASLTCQWSMAQGTWCSQPQQGCGLEWNGDGTGLFTQLPQEHSIKVPHAVKIESFFLLPLLRRNKMCKHISPLACSLSL